MQDKIFQRTHYTVLFIEKPFHSRLDQKLTGKGKGVRSQAWTGR